MKLKLTLVTILLSIFLFGLCNTLTLIILPDESVLKSHSTFIDTIEKVDSNIHLIYSNLFANESIIKDDEVLYTNLVIISDQENTQVEATKSLLVQVKKFIQLGGNLFFLSDQNASPIYRKIAHELGFSVFPPDNYLVDSKKNPLLNIPTDSLLVKSPIFDGSAPTNRILYQGTGLKYYMENSLITPLLVPSSEHFIINKKTSNLIKHEELKTSTLMLGGVQMANGKRAVVSGSLDFFSNKFFNTDGESFNQQNDNLYAAKNLISWCFGKKAVLVASDSKITSTIAVNDRNIVHKHEPVFYQIKLQYLKNDGSFAPFISKTVRLCVKKMHDSFQFSPKSISEDGTYYFEFQTTHFQGFYRLHIEHNLLGYSKIIDPERMIVYDNQFMGYFNLKYKYAPFYLSSIFMLFMTGLLVYKLANTKIKTE